MDRLFDLAITPWNALMGLLIIGSIGGLTYKFFPGLVEAIKEELSRGLEFLSGDVEKTSRPVYKIFYKYNHSNVSGWLNWAQTAEAKDRNQAATKLLEYLALPQDMIGAILVDVIRCIPELKTDESFPALKTFLHDVIKDWGRFVTAQIAFQEIITALLALDQSKGEAELINVMQNFKKAPKAVEFQKPILKLLCEQTINGRLLSFFVSMLDDDAYSEKIRILLIRETAEKEDADEKEASFFAFLKAFRTNLDLHEEMSAATERVMCSLMPYMIPYLEADKDEVKQLMLEIFAHPRHSKCFESWFMSVLSDETVALPQDFFYKLLMQDDCEHKALVNALQKRFKISEAEKLIIHEKSSDAELSFKSELLYIDDGEEKITMPTVLQKQYDSLESKLFSGPDLQPGQMFKVIKGDSDVLKLYMIKALAVNTGRKFVYINFRKLIKSAGYQNKLPEIVVKHKPALVYVSNYFDLSPEERHGAAADEIKSAEKTLKTINKIMGITMVTETKQAVLADEHEEILAVSKWDEKKRREVVEEYLLQLNDSREAKVFDVDAFLLATNEKFSLEFLSSLLKYFEVSLLSAGKLLDWNEYNSLS